MSEPLTASDFLDYCSAVASLANDQPDYWPLKRSRLPGVLAGALQPSAGVVDALLVNAVLGTALMFAALHLWGSALAGRVGGLATVALALTMSPIVLQSRMLTFYPMVNAGLALAAAGAAVAARTRNEAGMLLAGVGVGIALLSDVRALVWALPCLGVAMVVALLAKGTPARRAGRVLALLLPVAVSYPAGSLAFPDAAITLEKQVDVRPLYHLHGSRTDGFMPPYLYPSGYVWGRSPIQDLPATLGFLVDQARIEMPDDVEFYTPNGLIVRQVGPWTAAAMWTLPLGLLVLVRRPWHLWALAGTALPYALALYSMTDMVEMYPRFLTQGLPAVAITGGVVVGMLWGIVPWAKLGAVGPATGWVTAAALSLAIVLGAVPTPLSPTADWRLTWAPVLQEVYWIGRMLRSPSGRRPDDPTTPCVNALADDRSRLGITWSAWVPFSDRKQTNYDDQHSNVPSSTLGDQPGNAPPSAPPAGAVKGP